MPDLFLWKTNAEEVLEENGSADGKKARETRSSGEVMFAEVKSENDRLSDTQRLWINVLMGAGVRVELCNAVAKEVRREVR